MRLIDADQFGVISFQGKSEDFSDGVNFILEKIDNAPTVEIPQWIPCSDKLPEKNGRYIVTEKRFSIDDRKNNGRYQTVVEEVTFSNGIWNRANFIEVIAWMLVPEPYEEGENNE